MRVYSHSYWLVILVQPIAAECWREGGGKLSRILGKNTIFNEHPVAALIQLSQELIIAAKLGQFKGTILLITSCSERINVLKKVYWKLCTFDRNSKTVPLKQILVDNTIEVDGGGPNKVRAERDKPASAFQPTSTQIGMKTCWMESGEMIPIVDLIQQAFHLIS